MKKILTILTATMLISGTSFGFFQNYVENLRLGDSFYYEADGKTYTVMGIEKIETPQYKEVILNLERPSKFIFCEWARTSLTLVIRKGIDPETACSVDSISVHDKKRRTALKSWFLLGYLLINHATPIVLPIAIKQLRNL